MMSISSRKLRPLDWIRAGSLNFAGTTAYAAVRAVAPKAGFGPAVSGGAGGVGSIAVQLAKRADACVVRTASKANDAWLRSVSVEPVVHGDRLFERLRTFARRHRRLH